MDIQSILSLAIQVIFMGFVSLVFVDFVNGLFWLPYSYSAIAPIASTNQAIAAATLHTVPETIVAPESEPEFAQLPSPWDLDTDITPNSIPQPVVLEFPTLKLLPPVASVVQSKAKATTKSTKTRKTSKLKAAATPRKSRKKSAA